MGNKKIVPFSLNWYWNQSEGDEYLLLITPVWGMDVKRKDVDEKDLKDWVEKEIGADIEKGYIYVKDASYNKITLAFRSNKWLKDNFLKSPRVKFHIPRTLEWSFKKRLPDTLMSHAQWNSVAEFIEKKFKDFLKEHNKTIFKEKMKILKKVNYNWFTYSADLQFDKIYVRMKPEILITMVAAGTAAYKAVMGKNHTVDSWRNWE